jgi:hypothetical protein
MAKDRNAGLPPARNQNEEYQRYYVVLASIHDNKLPEVEKIDNGIWPQELAKGVWFRLTGAQPYGPTRHFIKTALDRVRRKAPGEKAAETLDDIDKKIIGLYQEAEKREGKIKLPGSRKIADALYEARITPKKYSHTAIQKRTQKLRKSGLIGPPDDDKGRAKRCTAEHLADLDGDGRVEQKF